MCGVALPLSNPVGSWEYDVGHSQRVTSRVNRHLEGREGG